MTIIEALNACRSGAVAVRERWAIEDRLIAEPRHGIYWDDAAQAFFLEIGARKVRNPNFTISSVLADDWSVS